MALRVAISLALAALCLSACGNSRTPVPRLPGSSASRSYRSLSFSAAGVSFRVPHEWAIVSEQAPLLVAVTSGEAVVALWRFPRVEALPTDLVGLARARSELINAARSRDGSLQVIRSKVVSIDGARAVELDAIERVGNQPRRVRSVHVFAYGAELVLDEYAPSAAFHAVDHAVFSPVERSLLLFAPASA